jgi:hypothetical protein
MDLVSLHVYCKALPLYLMIREEKTWLTLLEAICSPERQAGIAPTILVVFVKQPPFSLTCF